MIKLLKSRKYTVYNCIILFVLVWIDQLTKIWAQACLKAQESIVLIPNVLELSYLYPENRGIAFGMFQGNVKLFAALTVFMSVLILYFYYKLPKEKYYLPLCILSFLFLSGALGNFIDRVFRGYVIDFIYFSLIDFPVFNLADVYTVVAAILLIVFVAFKYKEEDLKF